MPRTQKRQLQWHKASNRWCKRYTDPMTGKKPVVYLGPGTPTRDGKGRQDELYDRALTKWLKIKEELDAQIAAKLRGEEIEGLEVIEQLSPDLKYRSRTKYHRQQLEAGADLKAVDVEQQHLQAVSSLAHKAVTPDDWTKVARAIARLDDAAPPRDRSIGKITEDFLAFKLGQAKGGQRSVVRWVTLKLYSGWFTKWLGPQTDIGLIDCDVIENYYNHLLGQVADEQFTVIAARDAFQVAKQALRWAASKGIIPSLPANIASRDLVFSCPAGKKVRLSIEEFRNLIDHANERTKLFMLLSANTGMTQKDISDLVPEDVDWERGLVSRKRSKSRHRASVDIVTHCLWPETFALLKKLGNPHGELVLRGRNGNPLVYIRLKDDRPVRTDSVANAFNRLAASEGVWVKGKSFKNIRATSSTLLKNGGYHHLVDLFMGHAPGSTADRAYAADYDCRLDEAIEFLRQEYLVKLLSSEHGAEAIPATMISSLSESELSLRTA